MDYEEAKDTAAATNALLDWFESQEIDPAHAVVVMALATAGICKMLGREKKGPAMIAGMIQEMMEHMGHGK